MPKNVEWIHIVLSFLKTYVEHPDTEMLIHEADKLDYVTRLVDSLRSSVDVLENGESESLFT